MFGTLFAVEDKESESERARNVIHETMSASDINRVANHTLTITRQWPTRQVYEDSFSAISKLSKKTLSFLKLLC